MSAKSNRTYKYGDQPIRITTVQAVEQQFGGAATAKQVDDCYFHIKKTIRGLILWLTQSTVTAATGVSTKQPDELMM